jgi:hypothetical protein
MKNRMVCAAVIEIDKTFYWRKAGSDYALIDSRTNCIRLRLTTQERAQHFTEVWNHVIGCQHGYSNYSLKWE